MIFTRSLFEKVETLSRDEAVQQIVDNLGWKRTSDRLRAAAESALDTARKRHIITQEAGELRLRTRSIGDYDRQLLPDLLLAALPLAWTGRDEACRLFARHLGFARTGKNIKETARKLISTLLRKGQLEKSEDGKIRPASL